MSLCVYCSTDEAIQWVLQHPDAGNSPADPVGCITLSNVVTGHVGNFKLRLGDHKEGEGGGGGYAYESPQQAAEAKAVLAGGGSCHPLCADSCGTRVWRWVERRWS
jgi:hypothetical protein